MRKVRESSVIAGYSNKADGESFMAALKLDDDAIVLEIGVGTGRLALRTLATGCKHFTGIDPSPLTIINL